MPSVEAPIRLYHCPFQKLEEVARIELNSVNLILTDMPYGEDFLPEVAELEAFAARVLVKGGLLVSYSGRYYTSTCDAGTRRAPDVPLDQRVADSRKRVPSFFATILSE